MALPPPTKPTTPQKGSFLLLHPAAGLKFLTPSSATTANTSERARLIFSTKQDLVATARCFRKNTCPRPSTTQNWPGRRESRSRPTNYPPVTSAPTSPTTTPTSSSATPSSTSLTRSPRPTSGSRPPRSLSFSSPLSSSNRTAASRSR